MALTISDGTLLLLPSFDLRNDDDDEGDDDELAAAIDGAPTLYPSEIKADNRVGALSYDELPDADDGDDDVDEMIGDDDEVALGEPDPAAEAAAMADVASGGDAPSLVLASSSSGDEVLNSLDRMRAKDMCV